MEYTNEKDNKLKSVIVGILYVIFGIIVVMNPMTTLLSISLIIGWGMLAVGAVLVLNGIRLRAFPQISTMNTIEGILLLLLGVMFLFTDFIKSTQILAYLMMFWIITDAALQLQFASMIRTAWARYVVIIVDIIVIVYAVSMLFNPSAVESFMVLMLGFGFIVQGVNRALSSL
ncbi:hypothetical protein G7061_09425 [Erysipelothrix sp. HDW6B]|uniref:DUF308 domain-containing protein n=1 Tax=Erysipelothrix TaxID=1647 RepID=UPI00135AA1A3|nr:MULTISPECIES: DUF308 domain-containing protein [Erysipelothrix]QIK86820.1 hypothetical protein G7061_09425 [Erysipelothrix sp. HDW6B]